MFNSIYFPPIGQAGNRQCAAQEIISTSTTATPGSKYLTSSLSRLTITLPPSNQCCIGDTVEVEDIGPGLFRIAQQSDQQIQIGSGLTTLGIAGKIDSLYEGTYLQLSYAGDGGWVLETFNENINYE